MNAHYIHSLRKLLHRTLRIYRAFTYDIILLGCNIGLDIQYKDILLFEGVKIEQPKKHALEISKLLARDHTIFILLF